MHGYDVHKTFYMYQNREIHGPWLRDSGHKLRPIWPYNENICNIIKCSSLLTSTFEINQRHVYDIHEVFYLNCKIMVLVSGVHVLEWCQYIHILKMHQIFENLLPSFHSRGDSMNA